jgi:hypothetical protein
MQNKFWMVGLIVLGVSSPVSLADTKKATSLTVGGIQGVVETRSGPEVTPERAVEVQVEKSGLQKEESFVGIYKGSINGHFGNSNGGGVTVSGGVYKSKENAFGAGGGMDGKVALNYGSGYQLRPTRGGINIGANFGYSCNSSERFSLLGVRGSIGGYDYDPLVDSGALHATIGLVARSSFAGEKVKGDFEAEVGWAASSGKLDHGKEVFIKGAADVNFTPGVALGLYVSDRAMKDVDMQDGNGAVNRHAQEAGIRLGGSW